MFIYVFEDGEVRKNKEFNEGDKDACDAGILDVIDISGDEPKQYYNSEWHDLLDSSNGL